MLTGRTATARALVCAASLVALFAAPSVAAAASKTFAAPALPSHTRILGARPASSQLNLTVSLQPQPGLESFATEVSTPGSPLFRQYLTVGQFAQQFGATPAAIAAVRSTLASDGLTVGSAMANGLTIPVTGSTAAVDHAFSTKVSQVQLANGRTTFANTVAATIPANIAPYVLTVTGLNNLNPPEPAGLIAHPHAHLAHTAALAHATRNVVTGGPQPCAAASDYAIGQVEDGNAYGVFTADQIAEQYGFENLYAAGDEGAGQTIALFEQQWYNPTDIAAYQACYGTSTQVTPVDVGTPPTQSGSDDEAALDIEQLIGLAPKANIQVYQGQGLISEAPAILSAIASADQAKTVSSSFGSCEQHTNTADPNQVQAEEPILEEMAAQGQSFFSSAGDAGSESCSQLGTGDNELSVEDPSGDPFSTAVGGTSLYPTGQGYNAQYVWNEGSGSDLGATGGGRSAVFAMPSYQTNSSPSLGVISADSAGGSCGATYCREMPDVSADADPATGYAMVENGAWATGNGTSAASPLWAAFATLTNAAPRCRGQVIGFVNPALYAIAASAYAANFTDITGAIPLSGYAANNDYTGTSGGLFPVGAGYDMATGLGTPIAGTLATSLCSLASPAYSVALTSPGNQESVVGHALTLTVHGADSGGQALTYAAAGLPAGLAMSPTTGAITGTPTTVQTTTVTVTAKDKYTNAGTITFPWAVLTKGSVGTNPKGSSVSGVNLTGLTRRRPKLTATFAAGSDEAALTSVSIKLPKGFSFAKKAKTLKKGLSVKSGGGKLKFTTKVKRGVLTITFKKSVRTVSLTLARPALSISAAEARKIHKHKIKKLAVTFTTKDTSHKSTTLKVELTKLK